MPFLRRRRSTGEPEQATVDEVSVGWNGVPWGSTIADFKAQFPQATRTDSGWWQTGTGPEEFCGIVMAYTQYGFNTRDELYMLSFIPDMPDRERLSVAAINRFGEPRDTSLAWVIGDVQVEIKMAGVVATMTHRRYARR
jgi:hypothetical protein